MKRLKVAMVSDALYPWHKGGKEVRYLHLLNGLPEYEMDISVYSMKWWDQRPSPIYASFGSLTFNSICPRVPMYRRSRRSVAQAVVFAVCTLRLLTREFDVIEADHMPYIQLLPLRVVAWIKRVPLVITWNEVWGKEGWKRYLGRFGFAAAYVERLCIRLPDVIVAVSNGTAEKLASLGAEDGRVVVVPMGLDLEQLLSVVADPGAPELIFVGRLLEHKHAEVAIEATRILTDRGNSVRLGIVGVGPEEFRLRRQVSEALLDQHVTFYGSVDSQDDLWSMIRGSRVMLAPSIREGFGFVVAESLALGTPVVCAAHPENESATLVGEHIGSAVPPLDAKALADAAEFWLNDDSERSNRSAIFLSDNNNLTIAVMTSSYAQILRDAA